MGYVVASSIDNHVGAVRGAVIQIYLVAFELLDGITVDIDLAAAVNPVEDVWLC